MEATKEPSRLRETLTNTAVSVVLLFAIFALGKSTPLSSSPNDLTSKCSDRELKERFQCYEETLLQVASSKSPQLALRILYDLQRQPAAVGARTCHDIAHAIGVEAFRRLGAAAVALGYGHETCGNGYFHGVMITMLEAAPNLASLPTVCDGFPASEDKFQLWHCLHGVGHGLMVARGYDLPQTLADCDRLRSYFEQEICATGVFMENAEPTHLGEGQVSPHLRLDDPWYPCNAVAAKYRLPCFDFSAGKLAALSGHNPQVAFERCQELTSRDDRVHCYRGATGTFALAVPEFKPKGWPCTIAPAEAHDMCALIMAMGEVDQNKELASGVSFCKSAPDSFKPPCFRGVGTIMVYIESRNRSAWPELCQALAGEFTDACLAGAEERWQRNLKWGAEP